MTTEEFYKLVEQLREAQDQFFEAKKMQLSTVAKMWYAKSKKLESMVDEEIKRHRLGAGQQQQLF